jgi:hypothetical protein
LIWFKIETYLGYGFHKMLGSSSVAAQLVASQERLRSVEVVGKGEAWKEMRRQNEIQFN